MIPGHRSSAGTGGYRNGRLLVGVMMAVICVALAGAIVLAVHHHRSALPTTTTTPSEHHQTVLYNAEQQHLAAALAKISVRLPQRSGAPAPAFSVSTFVRPLPSHQVFGFVPYWELGAAASLDFSQLTTVAYFSLGINSAGSLEESGLGWDDIDSQSFAKFRSDAHAAHVRVLLTVATVDQPTIDAISAAPAESAARLLAGLDPVLKSESFDGVDLDLEGRNGTDRAGFARFVSLVAKGLRAANSTYTLVVDTYPQSASDPDDFFDVASIAASANELFVMAYDMDDPTVPSANAPLTGAGLSDASALQTYLAVVPGSKIILGTPFYGVDWTLLSKKPQPGSASDPVTLDYSTIAAAGHTPLFDPVTDTVWFRYLYKGHEHETWFDDPFTLALKAALAAQYKIAGVGAWALGMEGANPEMLAALAGGSAVGKLPLASAASK